MNYLRDLSIRRKVVTFLLVAACFAPLSVGCDNDSTSEDDGSIAGSWVASLAANGSTQNVSMTMSEIDNLVGGKSISGSGTVESTARTMTFQITGSYIHPLLSLEAVFDVPPGTNPTGQISGQVNTARTEISATISGPDINGQVVFTRED